jgi:hypothetical protein
MQNSVLKAALHQLALARMSCGARQMYRPKAGCRIEGLPFARGSAEPIDWRKLAGGEETDPTNARCRLSSRAPWSGQSQRATGKANEFPPFS